MTHKEKVELVRQLFEQERDLAEAGRIHAKQNDHRDHELMAKVERKTWQRALAILNQTFDPSEPG